MHGRAVLDEFVHVQSQMCPKDLTTGRVILDEFHWIIDDLWWTSYTFQTCLQRYVSIAFHWFFQEFYATYDVWTGVRTAVTLALFFLFTVSVIAYKSRCKKPVPVCQQPDMPQPIDYCDYWTTARYCTPQPLDYCDYWTTARYCKPQRLDYCCWVGAPDLSTVTVVNEYLMRGPAWNRDMIP